MSRLAYLASTTGQVDYRSEDIAISKQDLSARQSYPHLRDGDVTIKGIDQVEGYGRSRQCIRSGVHDLIADELHDSAATLSDCLSRSALELAQCHSELGEIEALTELCRTHQVDESDDKRSVFNAHQISIGGRQTPSNEQVLTKESVKCRPEDPKQSGRLHVGPGDT